MEQNKWRFFFKILFSKHKIDYNKRFMSIKINLIILTSNENNSKPKLNNNVTNS